MEEGLIKKSISKKKRLKFILATSLFLVVIIFVIAELLLYLFHYQSSYNKMSEFSLTEARWWKCDSVSGPVYIKNAANKEDSTFFSSIQENWYYNRLKVINNDGYHDRRDFTALAPDNDSMKILFLGDSFTWGASADVDSSYVDVFKRDISKSMPANIVWNTGIPGTGTNHALAETKKYLPLQRSNYVILGFYDGNDFMDNLTPYDRLLFTNDATCINLYDFDKNVSPVKMTKREAFKKATGSYPMEELNILQKIIIRSRLVSFISDMKDKLVNRASGLKNRKKELAYQFTKDYLKQLNDYVKSNNAELIVLLIPNKFDLKTRGEEFLNATKIFNELSIKYFENTPLLSEKNYLHPVSKYDVHWNNSGHIITGHAFSDYFIKYLEGKNKKPL